jgi:hypothetical protein
MMLCTHAWLVQLVLYCMRLFLFLVAKVCDHYCPLFFHS